MNLKELTGYLDEQLQIQAIPDYSVALNGLQVENAKQKVTKIAVAVDAHLPVVEKAVAQGCDLLLVHHGIFWSGLQPITGPLFKKLQTCFDAGLAIYSAHLPLDGHLAWGNSRQLAEKIGVESIEAFFPYKGYPIGVRGVLDISRDELLQRLEGPLMGKAHLCPAGPSRVHQIGIVSGGAGSEVAAMKEFGIDTFITGEGPHWSYTLAEELGVNLIYGGHYATETFAVRALAEHLSQAFGIPHVFIDHPTGL